VSHSWHLRLAAVFWYVQAGHAHSLFAVLVDAEFSLSGADLMMGSGSAFFAFVAGSLRRLLSGKSSMSLLEDESGDDGEAGFSVVACCSSPSLSELLLLSPELEVEDECDPDGSAPCGCASTTLRESISICGRGPLAVVAVAEGGLTQHPEETSFASPASSRREAAPGSIVAALEAFTSSASSTTTSSGPSVLSSTGLSAKMLSFTSSAADNTSTVTGFNSSQSSSS
jgi:hypothetical protein